MSVLSLLQLLGKKGTVTAVQDDTGTFSYQASSAPNTFTASSLFPANFINGAGFAFTSPKGRALTTNSSADFILQTKKSSRDAEIVVKMDKAWVLLRVNGTRAVYFNVNGTDFSTGVALDINNLSYSTTPGAVAAGAVSYITISQDISAALAVSGDNSGNFTFGVSGFDLYAKYNGIEFFRSQQYDHLVAGSVGVKQMTSAGYMVSFTGNHFSRAPLFSDTDNSIVDIRDFGCKALQTTGSITGGQSTLTVANSSGFEIGDRVIVEIGGEATTNGFPAATRGALGVGGNWPSRHYANVAAMQADTDQALNIIAYTDDTRLVYENFGTGGGGWFKKQYYSTVGVQTHEENYYINYTLPISHRGIITGKNGNVLTLDTPCVNSTANANVYYDNIDILNWFTHKDTSNQREIIGTVITLSLPPGTFAVSEKWYLGDSGNWTIRGAGKDITIIKSPKGCPSVHFFAASCPGLKVYDFTLIGNGTDDGYGFVWWNKPANGGDMHITNFDYNTIDTVEMNRGLFISGTSNNCHVKNVKVCNTYTTAIQVDSTDNLIEYCDVVHDTGVHKYAAWMVEASGGAHRNIFDHITFTCPKQIGVFEAFNNENVTFSNITSINGTFSSNSAFVTKFLNCNVTFTANSLSDWMAADNFPCVNLNGNAYNNGQNGAVVDNMVITNQGYVDNGHNLKRGIVVQDVYTGATISNCSYIVDPSIRDLSTTEAVGFASTGVNTTFDHCTCVAHNVQTDAPGNQAETNANIYCKSGTVSNCTCDTLLVENSVTTAGNTVNKKFNRNP